MHLIRYRRGAVAIFALMTLAACGRDGGDAKSAVTAEQPEPAPILARDLLIRHNAPELTFNWSMAPEVAFEPGLFAVLHSSGEAALRAAQTDASADHREAAKGNYPFRTHSYAAQWAAEAETPQLLALVGTIYTYTGGAHGMTEYGATLWDRQGNTRIGSWDIFTDTSAAAAALTPQWCAELDRQRAEKRQGHDAAGFNDCPPITEQTLVPVGRPVITGLKVIAGPYAAGPYSEGSYEVFLGLEAVRDLVKPVYKESLAPA